MSEHSSGTGASGPSENLTMLFGQLVMQQANMAMMLMGKIKNPQSGETVKDLDSARLFIDELEMLEVKTKGNLTKQETDFLKQTLMGLRLAFVEAVDTPSAAPDSQPPSDQAKPDSSPAGSPPTAAAEEEHRKKFSKKY